MKMKSCLKYFFIITLILLVVYFGNYFFSRNGISNNNLIFFKVNPYILEIVIYVSLGLLLGLEHFIHEMKKSGTLKINITKLVLLGIPSLYFSLYIFIYFGVGRFLPNVLTYPIATLIRNGTKFMNVFQLILGYSIITSFYKKCDDIYNFKF